MFVLIYTPVFPPHIGGIETITMQLARGLDGGPEPGVGKTTRVTVVTPTSAGAMNDSALPFQIVRKPTLRQLAKLIWEADVLHVAGPAMLPLTLGWLFRKRMVVEHHGFQTACPSGQLVYRPTETPCPGHFMAGRYSSCLKCNAQDGALRSYKQLLLTFPRRWLCKAADANVSPTAWLNGVLQLPNMTTIYHGLPEKRVAASPKVSPPSIVFLGRLVGSKGVHVLLDAAAQLKDCDFRLKIIGDGPHRARLEAQAKELQLENRTVFLGYLDWDRVEETVIGASAVVMPSLGGEVFGLSALENMQRQKLLIVSDIGSLSEVVGDAGLTFPAGDARGLAACLRGALESSSFVDEMAARALARANSVFAADKMVSEHLSLYQRLAGISPTFDFNTPIGNSVGIVSNSESVPQS